jgi:beta-lactamase regulating signal transducer with metallopeptidase domain
VRLPSGAAKRHILVVLLILPLLTAAIPGRTDLAFRQLAWLDSGRILAVPLFAGLRFWHVVVFFASATVVVTFWQEVVPVLVRRRRSERDVPEHLTELARAMPGWSRCRVALTPSAGIRVATGGWPWRPRLLVSQGALDDLTEEELVVALRHENAHWGGARWVQSHALFAIRLLQSHNPVALWVFREYCFETEVQCDAEAVRDRNPKLLARILLRIYEATDVRDVAIRGAIRKRVDVLLGRDPKNASPPPGTTILIATALMLVILPWLV